MRAIRRLVVATLAVALLPAAIRAQSDSLRIARLSALGRLFGVVKYFHPAFLDRDVPWDSATVVAIDAVSAAKSADDYRTAVTKLLESLNDPATRVIATSTPAIAMQSAMTPTKRWEVSGTDSTLVIVIPTFENYAEGMQLLNGSAADVRRASSIVFDLRGAEPDELGTASFVFASVQSSLPTRPVSAPSRRLRMHSGFAPQLGGTSGGYWSGTYERAGAAIAGASTNRSRRVVFLANPGSDIPDVAFALRNAGQGAIVVEGATGAGQLRAGSETYDVQMGEGVVASVRLTDVGAASDADTVVVRGGGATGDAPLRVAIAYAKRPVSVPVAPRAQTSHVPAAENAYPSMHYPSASFRVLAAYRYWNAIHYFYPYKHLIGEDWGNVLPRVVRMLDSARDSLQFGIALAKMVAFTHDSHSGVTSNLAVRQYIGRLPTAALVQYVGGHPVVVRIADDSLTKASGIAVGDVIVKIDGVDAASRRT